MARDKAPADPMGGHVRVYWGIIDSPAWQALSWAAQGIYIAMRRQLKASNNGDISATLSLLRHHRVKSSSTLAAALRALETVGLIAKTRQGHIAAGAKVCNLYRFTDQAVYDMPKIGVAKMPATNDWKVWPNIRAADAAIRQADGLVKRVTTGDTSKLRNTNRLSSKSEAPAEILDSKSEQGRAASVRKTKLANVVAING